MSSNISTEQENKIQTFQEITQIPDRDLCIDILRENNWDVELSIDSFVHGRSRNRVHEQQSTVVNNISNTNNNPSRSTLTNRGSRSSEETPSSNTRTTRNNSFIYNILSPIKWLFQSRPISLTPEADTRKYISDFETKFGNAHPYFLPITYQHAVTNAYRASKFLLVYLHSPLHEDSSRFCSYVFLFLLLDNFISLLNLLLFF